MCGIWGLFSKSNIDAKDYDRLFSSFMKIKHRGPDYSSFDMINDKTLLGFHRLSIMDLSTDGNQPFHYTRDDGSYVYCVCNGEIYDYEKLKKIHNITTHSHSDCEVIIPLYEKFGEKIVNLLGSEFAFILIDTDKDGNFKILVGRDPIGIRPLFYGINNESICFSSEMKGLSDIYDKIYIFPPGYYMTYITNTMLLKPYYNYQYTQIQMPPIEDIYNEIKSRTINCVRKRLMTDRSFGALLSGGLDSSLVCAIIKYLNPNLKFPVFTITFKSGGTDLPYAKKVVEFLDLDHHIIEIEDNDALDALDETIFTIESYDITSVRASCMQLLIARYIKSKTDIRVLLCGENADELYAGYKYSHYAPNCDILREDNINLVKDVHKYDGLRTDRTMAKYGLEVRLPFGDTEIVDYVFSLPSELTAPKNGIEKEILRKSFSDMNILPNDVLWRNKEALSDGCSTTKKSWYEIIQNKINNMISDDEFIKNKDRYMHNTPFTKESYYYRKKFEEFFGVSDEKSKLIPHFWMPKWTDSKDPSARTLSVYKE